MNFSFPLISGSVVFVLLLAAVQPATYISNSGVSCYHCSAVHPLATAIESRDSGPDIAFKVAMREFTGGGFKQPEIPLPCGQELGPTKWRGNCDTCANATLIGKDKHDLPLVSSVFFCGSDRPLRWSTAGDKCYRAHQFGGELTVCSCTSEHYCNIPPFHNTAPIKHPASYPHVAVICLLTIFYSSG